jgi:Zn-dependent protease with chaperone function
MVVGMSTYLLGNLFQLAVSRKREHAADTSGAGIVLFL